ncbi:hypothetical protein OSB04_010098 [Centaurea solstitialis]|uniref:Ankyrin repeat domain-containing protein n=1 Tax=Centaurea solstitialis TaxID=347529 RepID=A0AA38WMS7_9ASTR|nr:hypothetical protein OSB04_010098 [Centaurea solstitialis]
MATMDATKYAHSPAHKAVVTKDYAGLRKLIAALPRLCEPSEIHNESISLAEEAKADAISAAIDRRDVPNRDTPLHLAVKLGDATSTEMLMLAGADWSLQNEHGWSALQEAICNREEAIAKISLFGIISRSRGRNGVDGCRGDGSEDGKVPAGSLCMISHKNKEVMNALDGAGAPASDAEVQQEVQAMSQTNIFRPGIDVTQAVLLPQMTWRRQEKTETVGTWKCKVYDMHNVVVSIKSRRVPGAMSDDEFFSSCNENETESEELNDILTDEERKQLEAALKMDSASDLMNENGDEIIGHRHSCYEQRDVPIEDVSGYRNGESIKHEKDKKGWFDGWRKRDSNKHDRTRKGGGPVPPRGSLCLEEKVSDLLGDSPSTSHSQSQSQIQPGRHSMEVSVKENESKRSRDLKPSSSMSGNRRKDGARENEYKKGLRPILWLAPNFPLRTEELLPLLDILANKVKAIRRLRDLLTTKLPMGTFPVKVAIPVIPTIRVLVTFTKFEELQPLDEFSTPPSSPTSADRDSPSMANQSSSSSSWFQWIKTPYHRSSLSSGASSSRIETLQDPFAIPADYTWISAEAKKKKMQEKNKSKKGRTQNQ